MTDREKDLEGAIDDLKVMMASLARERDELREILVRMGIRMRAWRVMDPSVEHFRSLPLIFDVIMESAERKERRLREHLVAKDVSLKRSAEKHRKYVFKKQQKYVFNKRRR